jgi:hypothetical protein
MIFNKYFIQIFKRLHHAFAPLFLPPLSPPLPVGPALPAAGRILAGRAHHPLRYPRPHPGQIDCITTLTTSSVVDPADTDQTYEYLSDIADSNGNNLKPGVSLMSYQSWMTNTFSFNITVVNVTISNITVRFLVLDNTFFTKAKAHFIVIWREGNSSNEKFTGAPPTVPVTYNNIDVAYGCK